MPDSDAPLALEGVAKAFTMHLRDGIVLPVVDNVSFSVPSGSCAVLGGPSGIGKSSILKMVFGNYRCDQGRILVRQPSGVVDVAQADPRTIVRLRQTTIGYVSQFLSVIPRVSARDIVAASVRDGGQGGDVNVPTSMDIAGDLLARLNVPQRLWDLPPATFSGGEQQRVNIARGFAANRPILLLDEPTASLDAENRAVVVKMLQERKKIGCAILGIFHDREVREAVADTVIDVTQFSPKLPDADRANNGAAVA
ncbi:MAG: phosphonate C-P lyase system protein PhnL [Pseudomonadota bacterium]